MTTLRQKLIDEIQLRGFSPHTQDSYVRSVTSLARFYHRPPDQIGDDEIKAYLLHLWRVKQLAVSSIIVAVSALRFFFGQILHRPTQAIEQALPRMKKPVLRPKVYSVQELEQLLSGPALNPKHRALFLTTYAAGLRVSEVCRLRLTDLLSDRHQIHVVQGKGKKDRYTLLSTILLDELRRYWRLYHPSEWLFTGRMPDQALTVTGVQRTFVKAKKKHVSPSLSLFIRCDTVLLLTFWSRAPIYLLSSSYWVIQV